MSNKIPPRNCLAPLALELPGKIAAPVQSIRLRKIFVRLFAVEKHELNLFGPDSDAARLLAPIPESKTCARASVVRSDELYGIK